MVTRLKYKQLHELHGSLFADQHPDTGWTVPEQLPVLDDRFKRVGFDYETNGTNWSRGAKHVGVAYALEDGRRGYLPTRHKGGGNLDPELVNRWVRTELRGKTLCCAEAKFEVHISRNEGIDLEAMGCKLREAQYKAALLDDTRRSFKLEDLGQDYLGVGKVQDVDRTRMWEHPAFHVAPYAAHDAWMHLALDTTLTEKVVDDDLTRVSDLEDDLIYAVCEMERNGALIDQKIFDWQKELTRELSKITIDTFNEVGFRVNFNKNEEFARVFDYLATPYGRTATGLPSFTDAFLRTQQDPLIQEGRRYRGLKSLKSKFIDPYIAVLEPGNILRYKLHQLKGDQYGTISGRFSSSSKNIQQVFAARRQAKKFPGADAYIIRRLFIPDPGYVWGKADASQIEFRLFADYSRSRRILQAYAENPWVDFHNAVTELMQKARPDIDRDIGKGLNFGMLYCMGRDKLANELELPLETASLLYDEYNILFPEVRPLIYKAIEKAEQRGYVYTLLGRKARFPEKYRLHSALNRIIQGSAADIMKTKILEVYRNRKELGIHKLRFTVHDELDWDAVDEYHVAKVGEFLNRQSFPLKVPILWETKAGPNWADLHTPKAA